MNWLTDFWHWVMDSPQAYARRIAVKTLDSVRITSIKAHQGGVETNRPNIDPFTEQDEAEQRRLDQERSIIIADMADRRANMLLPAKRRGIDYAPVVETWEREDKPTGYMG